MDVAWFLKQRISFIRYLYRDSTAPFVERLRLIEAGEPPFEPPYSEDGDPPYEIEWGEASDAVQMLGHTCVSMLAGALHVYFETWERQLGIKVKPEERKSLFRKGWLHGYRTMFSNTIGVQFDDSGADLGMLEQLVLARNRSQHPVSLTRVTPTHAATDLKRHPSPFFLAEHERDLLAHLEVDVLDIDSMWMIKPTLHVDADKLNKVLTEVERFAMWLDQACFDWIYGPGQVDIDDQP